MRTAVLPAVAILLMSMIAAPGASATCSDPFTQNGVQVYRSLSGVEVDWSFIVAPGCTVGVTVQARREVGDPEDIRSAVHRSTGPITLTSAGGQHVLNVLVTTPDPVHALLLNDGHVYRIVDIDPSLVP